MVGGDDVGSHSSKIGCRPWHADPRYGKFVGAAADVPKARGRDLLTAWVEARECPAATSRSSRRNPNGTGAGICRARPIWNWHDARATRSSSRRMGRWSINTLSSIPGGRTDRWVRADSGDSGRRVGGASRHRFRPAPGRGVHREESAGWEATFRGNARLPCQPGHARLNSRPFETRLSDALHAEWSRNTGCDESRRLVQRPGRGHTRGDDSCGARSIDFEIPPGAKNYSSIT